MTMRSQVRLYHLSSIIIAAVIATFIVNSVTYYAPRIEGYLFPVARSDTTLVEVLPQVNKIIVGGVMSKFRACDLISSVAYVSDAVGNRVIAKIEPASTIKLRPVESNAEWGPWRIDVPIWYKQAWLTVTTVHQCHPFWQTRSQFVRAIIE